MTTARATALLLAVLCLVAAPGPAQTLRSVCTAPTTIGLPYVGEGLPRVFLRGGDGRWRPAAARVEEGRLLLQLDPAALGTAEVMLLIDPPAGLVMDDNAGPAITAVEVDRKPLAPAPLMELGDLAQAPTALALTVRDAANALAPESFRLTIDGELQEARALRVTPAGLRGTRLREARLRVRLRPLEYGRHELVVTVADASPQTNETRWVVRFNYVEAGNLALASQGTKVAVDSCFTGYESLLPLTDGATQMPGDHCGNDISWASAETSSDHWVELTFARPTAVKEVTCYWAAYTDVSHTPRHFAVQVPEGDTWRAVYTSPAGGEKPAPLTTARFDPVTVSKLRVFMPKGEGSQSRPNLLWIGEIKVR